MTTKKKSLGVSRWLREAIYNPTKAKKKFALTDGFEVLIKKPEKIGKLFAKTKKNKPIVFLISGPSESGKSYFGTRLLVKGFASRIKILSMVATLQKENKVGRKFKLPNGEPKPTSYLESLGENDSELNLIVNNTIKFLNKHDTPIASLETIKHPNLLKAFQKNQKVRAISLYIDAPEELRVRRETIRTKQSKSKIKQEVRNKDRVKIKLGLNKIYKMADIIVCNKGELSSYNEFLSALGQQALLATRSFRGKVFEYQT